MPNLKCPSCKKSGDTGIPWGPSDTPGPDILVKPGNVQGTTKSLLYCRRCDTPFLKGPVGRGQPVRDETWRVFAEYMKQELSKSGTNMAFYEKY